MAATEEVGAGMTARHARVRALLLAACLLAAGCAGPGYYLQAIGGHWTLMRAREQIAVVLDDPATDPALAQNLRSAHDILNFAETVLDLPANDSYSSYVETGRSAVVWNVIAAPEFSLQARKWCFPVAGCVPYRGYFEADKAQRFANRLRAKGLDVTVRPSTAYSTLGWFSDPLLDTMMATDDKLLAATLFHELAHQRLYVSGDTAFSEAYASFMEREGVHAWLASQDRHAQIVTWRQRLAALDDFNLLQAQTRTRLTKLYASSLPEPAMREAKQQVLTDLQAQYQDMVRERWNGSDWFGGWFASGFNNAGLALFSNYHSGLCAFARLFEDAGGDFEEFQRLAARQAQLPDAARATWLGQACTGPGPDIAPGGDM